MTRILNNWLISIFLLSLIAIGSALIAEYLYNLIPCKMCMKQRQTYYFIIGIVILFYFFRKTKNIWLYILNELAILYGLFYAIWHVGIEQKILKGPASCSGVISATNSIKSLKEQIINQPIENCSEVTWSFLGLSAATSNSILLLFILTFNTIFILKNYLWFKKN